MKAIRAILWLSLAANLALVATWFWPQASSPATVTATGTAFATKGSVSTTVAPTALPAPSPQTWKQLSAADDAEFVARLRAEGFPPNRLYALAYARLRERHAAELQKFQPSADFAYWRRTGGWFAQNNDLSPEQRAGLRALNREMADELRQLLGPDADPATTYQRANRERLYGDLPVEKADQLAAISRDYSELTAMVRDRTQGVTLPEDRAQLAAMEAEKRADLAQLLSPEELFEYDLRSSPSANSVRSRLRHFEPTEEEYRALTALQIAFDQTYGGANPSGADQARRREAAAELTAQVKALLPPERFAEYETKTDPAYSSLANMVSSINPSADIAAAVGVQRDLAQRYNALRQNRDLAPDVRNAQLDALSAEANTRMAAALGPDAFKVFKGNGSTINSLLNRPAPKP
jgi:hypothetical protein